MKTVEEIQRAKQEVEDMANHPSMKKGITASSMCVIFEALDRMLVNAENIELHKEETKQIQKESNEFDVGAFIPCEEQDGGTKIPDENGHLMHCPHCKMVNVFIKGKFIKNDGTVINEAYKCRQCGSVFWFEKED